MAFLLNDARNFEAKKGQVAEIAPTLYLIRPVIQLFPRGIIG